MSVEDIKYTAQNTMQKGKEMAKKMSEETGEEIIKSSKDWLSYVKSHPLQSVLFGIIGCFALKGVLKN